MKVLVTGARGFIGTALVSELLARGADVTATTRGSLPGSDWNRLRWYRLDHLSQQSWNDLVSDRFDVIFHLGWSTIPRTAEADPVSDLSENVGGGLRLLTAVKTICPTSRVVFASSGGTIYGASRGHDFAETDPLLPKSSYGASKLAFENYLLTHIREGHLGGISVRLSNPYGPRQNTNLAFGAVSTFVRSAVRRDTIQIFGSGSITRDYVYISDVSRGLCRIAEADNLPSVVNLGSGLGTSLLDVVHHIGEALGRAVDYEMTPGRAFDVDRVVLDLTRLKAAVGWIPEVSIRKGICTLIAHEKQIGGMKGHPTVYESNNR